MTSDPQSETSPRRQAVDAIDTRGAAAGAAVCYLARQPGLPPSAGLRIAVVSRHPSSCDWCVYPLDALLDWIRDYNERPRSRRAA